MSSRQSLSGATVADRTSRRDSFDTSKLDLQLKAADLEKALVAEQSLGTSTPRTAEGSEANKSEPASTSSSITPQESRRSVHGWRWALLCASLYVSAFTYGLDTTIAADVQGAVVEAFDQVQQVSWLATGFMLGSITTILPIGNLYNRFDNKWLFISGLVIFEVGSVVCGAAPSMNALIVGRVIAGIGGSGVYLGALNYFTALTNETERGVYINGIGIVWGAGAILGPIISGAFSDSKATWRWAFYINLVIAAICAPPILLFLPSLKPMSGKTVVSRLASIDWLGTILSAAMWIFFVVALTFAGATYEWNDSRVVGLLVAFAVSLIAFIVQQWFSILTTKTQRIYPAHLIKSRTQVLLYVGTAASITSLFLPVYYLPLYFQFVHGDSAILAAVRLLPFVVVSVFVNFAFGFFLPKVSHYFTMYIFTGAFVISGAAALYTVTPDTPIANVYGYSVLVAIGTGATLQSGYTLASIKVSKQGKPEDAGNTISFQNIAQTGSGTIALVIANQLFQTFAFKNLSAVLDGRGFSPAEIRAAIAGTQSAVFESIDQHTAELATAAITTGMSNVYILVIVAGATTLIAAMFMRWERLFSA